MATHTQLGDGTGHFARVFRVLRLIRGGGASATIDGLDQLQTECEAIFDADGDNLKVLRDWLDWYRATRAVIDQRVAALRTVVTSWAFNYVKDDINSKANSVDGIFRDLAEVMHNDSEEVLENVITTSAVSADSDNVGDGTIVVYDQDPKDKRDNNRIQTAQYTAECIVDERTGGATAGRETFLCTSNHSAHGDIEPLVGYAEAVDNNRLDNGDMEAWTSTDPDSWTITTGAANIAEETTEEYRSGGSAAVITADGNATALDMEQAETAFVSYSSQKLKPGVPYLISCRLKRGGTAIDGTFTVQFSGTGYSPGSGETISVTSLTTSYVLYSAVVVMPSSIPSDFNLEIVWNGTPTSGRIIYLDDLVLQEMTEWESAGLWVAVVRGATDFIQNPDNGSQLTGDYFTWNTAREAEGTSLIQDFMTLLTNTLDPDGNTMPDIGIALKHASTESTNWADSHAS